jgi:hypothetical protein
MVKSLLQNRNLTVADRVFKKPKTTFFNPENVKKAWGSNCHSLPDLDIVDRHAAKQFYMKNKPYLKITGPKKRVKKTRRPGRENCPGDNVSVRTITSTKSMRSQIGSKREHKSKLPKWRY